MAVITRNDYGAIAVNKGVIERMMIEDLLVMQDHLLLCNKKGKLIKEKPTPFIDPDYFDAVEYSEKRGESNIRIYIIVKKGTGTSHAADMIFDAVKKDFELLRLPYPESVRVKVKGVMGDDIVKRNVEFISKKDDR